MPDPVSVAIVGDYDPTNETHRATEAALAHAAASLGVDLSHRWVPTLTAVTGTDRELAHDAAVWIAPKSPYASMEGALAAIRFAREVGRPLLGTCAGFQHIVIEYARNVLGFRDAEHAEYDPSASNLFVTPLSCSLVGKAMRVTIDSTSRTARWYGATDVEERYYCNFGLNPMHQQLLDDSGLRVVAVDAGGEARILELSRHPFFVGTLFVPQTRSSASAPHPLVVALVRAAAATRLETLAR
jgi:CTP synthase (UTP-ammonia lyase)